MDFAYDVSYGAVPFCINEEGTYLFCAVKHAAGHWSFPKGHKDLGEIEEQTVRRELYEEAMLHAKNYIYDPKYYESYMFDKDGVHYFKDVTYHPCFTGFLPVGPDRDFNEEIAEARWFTYQELLEQLTFDTTKEIAKKVNEYITQRKFYYN